MSELGVAIDVLKKRQQECLEKARVLQSIIDDLSGIVQGGADLIEKRKKPEKTSGICQNCGKAVKKFKYCNSECRRKFFANRARETYREKHGNGDKTPIGLQGLSPEKFEREANKLLKK